MATGESAESEHYPPRCDQSSRSAKTHTESRRQEVRRFVFALYEIFNTLIMIGHVDQGTQNYKQLDEILLFGHAYNTILWMPLQTISSDSRNLPEWIGSYNH